MKEVNADLAPIYHEVGHWMVANNLGYLAIIKGDLQTMSNFSTEIFAPISNTILGYNNRLVIAFGGRAAEELLKLPLSAGYIGDVLLACDHLEKLYDLEGRIFNYKNYMDFPEREHEIYINNAKDILNQMGGKTQIIDFGKQVYKQLQQKSIKKQTR